MTRFFPEDTAFKTPAPFPEEEYEDDPMSYEKPSRSPEAAEALSQKRARLMSILRQTGRVEAPAPQPKPVQVPAARRPNAPAQPVVLAQFWEDGPDEFTFDYAHKPIPKAAPGSDLSVLQAEQGIVQLEDGTLLVKSGKTFAVSRPR